MNIGSLCLDDTVGDYFIGWSGAAVNDPARAWGPEWSTPSCDDWTELMEKCTWTENRAEGFYLITGPNGNSIRLRAYGYKRIASASSVSSSGIAYYWTSDESDTESYSVYRMAFVADIQGNFSFKSTLQNYFLPVRPVMK